jgi:putative membrane protein
LERETNQKLTLQKTTICSIGIVLFHLVGLYGFLTPGLIPLFIKLVPFHLLLMMALLIVSCNELSLRFIFFCAGVYFAGFLVEVLGVNTGLIFGSYSYGKTLGIKLWDTPLMIGVNWLILVYSTGVFLEKIKISNQLLTCFIGAAILVLLDILIEPIAIRFDYWSWSGDLIPLQNYIGWFIVSFIMFWFFTVMDIKKKNPSAIVLLVAQVAFFLVLNIRPS